MALSKEILLRPRYKVIADWPGVAGKVCVGDIFDPDPEDEGMFWINGEPFQEDKLKDYPHLFQKMEWHEDRAEGELPQYVKNKETGKIFRIAPPDQDGRIWHNEDEIENRHFKGWPNSFIPSDIEEFNSQKQTTNG